MPKVYEQIKQQQLSKGQSLPNAKTTAAKIYNSIKAKHPSMQKLSNKPDKQSNNAGNY